MAVWRKSNKTLLRIWYGKFLMPWELRVREYRHLWKNWLCNWKCDSEILFELWYYKLRPFRWFPIDRISNDHKWDLVLSDYESYGRWHSFHWIHLCLLSDYSWTILFVESPTGSDYIILNKEIWIKTRERAQRIQEKVKGRY